MQPIESIDSRAMLMRSAPRQIATIARSGNPSFADAIQAHAVGHVLLEERAVDARESDAERQRDVVGEDQRRRAGAALAAVDRDPVGPLPRRLHRLGQVLPELGVAHGRFDPDRQPGGLREVLDEPDEAGDVGEGAMAVGADAVGARLDAADLAISSVTLWGREDAALPGLAPCESMSSMPRTVGAPARVSRSFSIEKLPSRVRHPK
jgi:hypothetical protein